MPTPSPLLASEPTNALPSSPAQELLSMIKRIRRAVIILVVLSAALGPLVRPAGASALYWQHIWPFPDCYYPCTPELDPDHCSCVR